MRTFSIIFLLFNLMIVRSQEHTLWPKFPDNVGLIVLSLDSVSHDFEIHPDDSLSSCPLPNLGKEWVAPLVYKLRENDRIDINSLDVGLWLVANDEGELNFKFLNESSYAERFIQSEVSNLSNVSKCDSIYFVVVAKELIVYSLVEETAKYVGGNQAFKAYVLSNLNFYPIEPKKGKMSLFIRFIVEKNGSISNVKVIEGFDDGFNAHVQDIIAQMPKWSPGKQNGEAIRQRKTIIIPFSKADFKRAKKYKEN